MLQQFRYFLQFGRATALLVLILLSACDSQQKHHHDLLVIDGSTLDVALPQRLRAVEAIDPAAVRVIATVNGVETELASNNDGRYSGQIAVPTQSEFTVRIDYLEMYSGQQLTLARAERVVATDNADVSLILQRQDYDYSSFDFDGDNASNIFERQYNTSPLDSAQLPELVQVEVFAELPSALSAAGFTDYQVVATLGNESKAIDASEGQFRHTFIALKQSSLIANVRLVERVTGQNLTIGQQEVRQIPDSQFSSQNSTSVVFNSDSWRLDNDQDADGISDTEELIAGTDILNAPASNRITYMVSFDVPSEIENAESAFATLEIDGRSTALNRVGSTYTASATVQTNSRVSLDAQVFDTVQGMALVLASFSGTATPVQNGTLRLEGFSLQHDADNDSTLNYQELAQGSDPFSGQCTPVTNTLFATLTDDAYVQNSRIQDNSRLQVDSDRRVALIRFQFDGSVGEINEASLHLTVGNDEGDGMLTVSAVAAFDWDDQGSSLTLPAASLAGSADNEWEQNNEYSFVLNPALITNDVTLIIQQSDGNDVAFQSGNTSAPPALELTVERCE